MKYLWFLQNSKGKERCPVLKASIVVISSAVNSKSKISMFSIICCWFDGFGIGITSSWIKNLRTTWAADFPYFLPIFFTRSSKCAGTGSDWSTAYSRGRVNGEKAVKVMPLALQNAVSFFWLSVALHSTWFVTGLMRQFSRTLVIWELLKLLTPIDLVRP